MYVYSSQLRSRRRLSRLSTASMPRTGRCMGSCVPVRYRLEPALAVHMTLYLAELYQPSLVISPTRHHTSTMSLLRRGLQAPIPKLRLPRVHVAAISTHAARSAETAFSQIKSKVDTSSSDFKDNAAQLSELTASLRSLHQRIALGGPEKARAKHIERKKMLPRE